MGENSTSVQGRSYTYVPSNPMASCSAGFNLKA
jgi:hypothetical protein